VGIETVRGEPRRRVLNEAAELGALGRVLAETQAHTEVASRKRAEKRRQPLERLKPVSVLADVAVARLVALSEWRRSEWPTLQRPEID
jgi:hypothetical protein